jgi:hypothetical protein
VLKSNVACDFTDFNMANADDFNLAEKVHELGSFSSLEKI